jgi:hypothetical protein
MKDDEESRLPAHAGRAAPLRTHESRSLSERHHTTTRPPSNWAWATSHDRYDWMDSHTPSNELDQV